MNQGVLWFRPKAQVGVKAVPKRERIVLIDMLRGVAMVVMALDHSGFFARTDYTAESVAGVRPELGRLPHVLTGLATNIATPIFYLLAGTSVAFFESSRRKRAWTEWQISRFLLIRALILIVFDRINQHVIYGEPQNMGVLSGLACALVILSLVRMLPLRVVAIAGSAAFLGHPLLVAHYGFFPAEHFSPVIKVLIIHDWSAPPYVEFPIMGWSTVALLGYVLGRLLLRKQITITPRLLWVALGGFLVWFGLRLGGGFGNFLPYDSDQPLVYFFVMNKQPPSIAYLLFNLSWALWILVLLQQLQSRFPGTLVERMLTTFGQTALFFFVVHLYLYGKVISEVIPPTFLSGAGIVRGYLEFAMGIAILYPLCAAYNRVRRSRPNSILRYL